MFMGVIVLALQLAHPPSEFIRRDHALLREHVLEGLEPAR